MRKFEIKAYKNVQNLSFTQNSSTVEQQVGGRRSALYYKPSVLDHSTYSPTHTLPKSTKQYSQSLLEQNSITKSPILPNHTLNFVPHEYLS